ncbi:rho guanine nucleotide exchange factor 12 [Schistocerca serialis cubense]|uniref:rho guanine nucleotide exchange factor 12 n=1 Tax=Schistocerca serialis cubense TaxID=2023355 RepID=UPI00214EAB8E|nr:rho guanine nucleotide exchange factor 12 [Schistocerca serialis cubense]
MDNPTYGFPERAGGVSPGLSNGPSLRRAQLGRPGSGGGGGGDCPPHTVTIIVTKDDNNSYGMKISGDKPVYVQSVNEGGAAERAGLNAGDTIVKVNGVNVMQSTHVQVVELIRSSTRVALTVRPAPTRPLTLGMASPRPLHHHHSAPARNERITPPQPVDVMKQREVDSERVHTLRLMLEQEQMYVEKLRSELARAHDAKLVADLRKAENHVRTLEAQIAAFSAGGSSPGHPYALLFPSPTCNSPSPSTPACQDIPPPLPSRNRPLTLSTPPPPPRHTAATALHCSEGGGDVQPIESLSNAHLSPTNNYLSGHQIPALNTHHRTKSSPDPLNIQNLSPAEASRQLIASESMLDLSFASKRSKSTGSSCNMESPRATPPGTPPPPYGGSSTNIEGSDAPFPAEDDSHPHSETPTNDGDSPSVRNSCQYATIVQQERIISMEDDDMSDQEVGHLEDHGPFKSLSTLRDYKAHLAVFLNYLRSNSDCSSLLFYLITDIYKEGNAKEMKKWAYEIHSSFLVPNAPLTLSTVDENVLREIDEVLLKESDKEEILRKVFWKARQKAKEELNEQLADFQQKRTAGLSSLFGAQETQLHDCINDRNKEMEIAKEILLSIMESYKEDLEKDNVDNRRFTMAAAMATVMTKVFMLRGPHLSPLLERCPTFVSKDKSLKSRLIGKSRKLTIRGHHFVAHQYYTVTRCNACDNIIGGIGPQGYQCTDCSYNIHRNCVRDFEEHCPGPAPKKDKTNDRISKVMEIIRTGRETKRKPSSINSAHIERVRRSGDDESFSSEAEMGSGAAGERPAGGAGRRPDPVRESEERADAAAAAAAAVATGGTTVAGGGGGAPHQRHSHHEDDDGRLHHDLTQHAPRKPSNTTINRSESYKERVQKRQLRERRKTSDPNLSKTNDVEVESQGLSYNNSGSSSNSSLSTSILERMDVCRSLDSPSNSLEAVSGGQASDTLTLTPPAPCSDSGSSAPLDSDLEAEPDPPDWMQGVEEEVLQNLSPREKKRQEVINELFHTERSHVRNLKVLNQVFYRPMLENQILPPDQIQLLFSNLEEVLEIHSQFNNGMKRKRSESPVVGELADLLLSMFDGPSGENFQRAVAKFCARQQIALESLKERRRKDSKLNSFLMDAEGNPLCRRLQLKDIIPTAMQRLTKYPLLFESLAKYTSESSDEVSGVQRAVERSKEILNHVNHAVREAEDNQRLLDIQKRLDKSGFEKVDHPMAGEFKNLDLTKHKLIYEGPLNWRISNRQKLIDLHVLLLDDVIILLQKQDEKYCLKFYNTITSGSSERMPTLSPVIKVSTVLVRHNAVDQNALYLVNTSHNGAQIYELVAATPNEKKTWFRHISEAAEAYKTRDGKGRRPEPPPAASSGPPDAEGADATKENDESLSDSTKDAEAAGQSATAATSTSESEGATAAAPTQQPAGAQAASPSASPGAELDPQAALSRKMGERGPSPTPGPAPTMSPSPGAMRRRHEPVRLTTEESPLVQPCEVIVSHRPVLTAEPVIMPIEKLRRKDEEIRLALDEKRHLVADILNIPKEEFDHIAEMAAEPAAHKEGAELALAAIAQVNQLTTALNEALRVTEDEVVRRSGRIPTIAAHSVQGPATSLSSLLTQILKLVKEQEEEKERLRRELQRLREQVHVMHEARRRKHNHPNGSDNPGNILVPLSQPESCVTVSSHSEDDTGCQRLDIKDECDGEPRTTSIEPIDDPASDLSSEVFVDALSGEAESQLEAEAVVETTAEATALELEHDVERPPVI